MAQHGQELVLGAAPRLGLGTGIPLCLVEPRVLDRDGGLRREPDHDALRVVREHPGLGVPEEEPAQDLAGAPPHGDRQVARDRQAPHRRAAVRHVPPVTRVLRHVVEAYDALPRERGREERRVPRRAKLLECLLRRTRERVEVVAALVVGRVVEEGPELGTRQLRGRVGEGLEQPLEVELGREDPPHRVEGHQLA